MNTCPIDDVFLLKELTLNV